MLHRIHIDYTYEYMTYLPIMFGNCEVKQAQKRPSRVHPSLQTIHYYLFPLPVLLWSEDKLDLNGS